MVVSVPITDISVQLATVTNVDCKKCEQSISDLLFNASLVTLIAATDGQQYDDDNDLRL